MLKARGGLCVVWNTVNDILAENKGGAPESSSCWPSNRKQSPAVSQKP